MTTGPGSSTRHQQKVNCSSNTLARILQQAHGVEIAAKVVRWHNLSDSLPKQDSMLHTRLCSCLPVRRAQETQPVTDCGAVQDVIDRVLL